MMELVSEATLRAKIQAEIKALGKAGMFISGSFMRTERKCGSKKCACATGGAKHPCCLLTSKVSGKTKAVYIPVDMADEVEGWVAEHRRIKAMLKEIDELGQHLIKIHVASKRRRERNIAAARDNRKRENP